MALPSLLSCFTSLQVSLFLRVVNNSSRLHAEDHVRANSVPAIKPPGLEMSCISGRPTEDAKENGEVNSSTPQSPQSKSTPVTPVKGSPGANHLNRPMSDSLRQKLKRRRPLHSPTKSSGGDEVSLESPLKKQRTSLHGPPRSIHSVSVTRRIIRH